MKRFLILASMALTAACQPAPPPVPSAPPNFVSSRDNLVLGDATTLGQFEVIRRSSDTASHLWCAAGEYALRVLGRPVTERIYVAKPLSRSIRRPDRKSVIFTVVPDQAIQSFQRPANDFSLTVSRVGENQTTGAAHQFCQQLPPRYPFWF